jgi:hypothetical protein
MMTVAPDVAIRPHRRDSILAFFLALVAGAATWLFWRLVFGISEPWDGTFAALYPLVLGVCGAGIGYAAPGKPLLVLAGGWIGQLIGLFSTGSIGPLAPLGAAMLFPFTLPLVVGALIGGWLRRRRDSPTGGFVS